MNITFVTNLFLSWGVKTQNFVSKSGCGELKIGKMSPRQKSTFFLLIFMFFPFKSNYFIDFVFFDFRLPVGEKASKSNV